MSLNENTLETIRALLANLSEPKLRASCVAALQQWWQRSPSEHSFTIHDFGPDLIESLADSSNIAVTWNRRDCMTIFQSHKNEDWYAQILEFVWWMVRAGLAIPQTGQHETVPPQYKITRAGALFLGSAEDHPLAPGFLARLRSRCPAIPDAAFELLLDANACLEVGLVRPAVTIMGVAYEFVVERALLTSGCDEDEVFQMKAWKRISRLREKVLECRLRKEEESAALHACNFADNLRARRNDATHTKPRFPFDSTDEGEELIISACRHLLALAPLLSS